MPTLNYTIVYGYKKGDSKTPVIVNNPSFKINKDGSKSYFIVYNNQYTPVYEYYKFNEVILNSSMFKKNRQY
jgi:hypothetical protein